MLVRSPKVLLPVGLALALGALILAAPRTVQAVAAALVQITNTASNPVVTQTTGAQAANMVHLECTINMSGDPNGCYQVAAKGVGNPQGGTYTVPSGNYLVITAADVYPDPFEATNPQCPGAYNISVDGLNLTTSNNPVTTHFTYPPPSGVVFGPGNVIQAQGIILTGPVVEPVVSCQYGTQDQIDLYGYLTTT